MLTKSAIAVVATALTFSCPAWAADTSTPVSAQAPASAPGPLAPGKAAGVRGAQETATDNTLLIVGGLAVVGVGVGLLVSNNGHDSSSTSSTGRR